MEKSKSRMLFLFFFLFLGGLMGCSNRNISSTNYGQYLNKIWVVKDKDYIGNMYDDFSFVITRMEPECVEGQYLKKGLKSFFTGTLNGSMIECKLWSENENAGSMTLDLIHENEIKATVKYSDKNTELYEELIFQPYSVEDVIDLVINDEKTVTAEMNKWGKVKIVSGIIDINKMYPAAFMVNEQGNILYEFDAPYKTGTTIGEIKVADYNEDGLDDIDLVTYFKGTDIKPIHWIYYQDEGATFHLEEALYGEE